MTRLQPQPTSLGFRYTEMLKISISKWKSRSRKTFSLSSWDRDLLCNPRPASFSWQSCLILSSTEITGIFLVVSKETNSNSACLKQRLHERKISSSGTEHQASNTKPRNLNFNLNFFFRKAPLHEDLINWKLGGVAHIIPILKKLRQNWNCSYNGLQSETLP